ncbi:hypothetical protein [Desulfobacter postgatei]
MSREEAVKLKMEIQKLCEQRGVWFDVNHVHKPDLKDIIITISVRITEK